MNQMLSCLRTTCTLILATLLCAQGSAGGLLLCICGDGEVAVVNDCSDCCDEGQAAADVEISSRSDTHTCSQCIGIELPANADLKRTLIAKPNPTVTPSIMDCGEPRLTAGVNLVVPPVQHCTLFTPPGLLTVVIRA